MTANTPVFTSSSDTTAAVGTPFSFTVSANGNPEPNITESGALPSGVTFAGRTGGIGDDLGYRRGRDRWRLPPHPQGHQ